MTAAALMDRSLSQVGQPPHAGAILGSLCQLPVELELEVAMAIDRFPLPGAEVTDGSGTRIPKPRRPPPPSTPAVLFEVVLQRGEGCKREQRLALLCQVSCIRGAACRAPIPIASGENAMQRSEDGLFERAHGLVVDG